MTKRIDEEKQDQRNLFVAMLAVIAVLFLSKVFFPSTDIKNAVQEQTALIVQEDKTDAGVAQTFMKTADLDPVLSEIPESLLKPIRSNLVAGTLSTQGGVLNNLALITYKQSSEKNAPDVQLLNGQYFARLKWMSADVSLPESQAVWQAEGSELTPFSPLQLTWTSHQVRLRRTIALDEGYMFTITDELTNLTDRPVQAALSGRISRILEKEPARSTVHEGFLGYFNGRLNEETYDSISKDPFSKQTVGGWLGMTDKYWQTLFVLSDEQQATAEFLKVAGVYEALFTTSSEMVAPGQTLVKKTRLFAGAKDMELISAYEKNLNIPRFDLSIDFGWFYFLTKPFMIFLNWLYNMVGNMGIAILIFATLLRIALLPIATKSYESMAKMRKIQPKIQALQARYKEDKMRLQQELMALYKRDKVNPASGCLPMLIQIPVFFALYKVLSVSIHMRQAPFFGWIRDLSVPDPASVLTAFGYIPWPVPTFLDIGVWPVLMGITMWIQQKMNPAPMDKSQANVFKLMPILFTFMLGNFAAGLVIYWTWSNILSILQQKYIMKKVGV